MPSSNACSTQPWKLCLAGEQASTAPWAKLRGLGAISITTSVHAVKHPRLPLENRRANAAATAARQCALQCGRPIAWWGTS
jgi:hypothetical protein